MKIQKVLLSYTFIQVQPVKQKSSKQIVLFIHLQSIGKPCCSLNFSTHVQPVKQVVPKKNSGSWSFLPCGHSIEHRQRAGGHGGRRARIRLHPSRRRGERLHGGRRCRGWLHRGGMLTHRCRRSLLLRSHSLRWRRHGRVVRWPLLLATRVGGRAGDGGGPLLPVSGAGDGRRGGDRGPRRRRQPKASRHRCALGLAVTMPGRGEGSSAGASAARGRSLVLSMAAAAAGDGDGEVAGRGRKYPAQVVGLSRARFWEYSK